jgi:hypothetical protein
MSSLRGPKNSEVEIYIYYSDWENKHGSDVNEIVILALAYKDDYLKLHSQTANQWWRREWAKWATAQGLACLTPVLACVGNAFSPNIVVVCLLMYFYLRPAMKKELTLKIADSSRSMLVGIQLSKEVLLKLLFRHKVFFIYDYGQT